MVLPPEAEVSPQPVSGAMGTQRVRMQPACPGASSLGLRRHLPGADGTGAAPAPALPRLLSDPLFTDRLLIFNMGSRNFPYLTFVVFIP